MHGIGDCDTAEFFAFAERPVADHGHAVGNIILHLAAAGRIGDQKRFVLIEQHMVAALALIRSGLIVLVPAVHADGAHRLAAAEERVVDAGDGFGNVDMRKRLAVFERALADLFQALAQRHARKARAAVKCQIVDLGHIFGDGHLFKAHAVGKGALAQDRQLLRQVDPAQALAAVEHAAVKLRQRLRQLDALKRDAVFKRPLPDLYVVLRENAQRLHTDAVAERAVLNALHILGDYHLLQRRAAAESLRFDLLQRIRQIDIVQRLAVLERIGADNDHAVVHGDGAAVVLAAPEITVLGRQAVHRHGGQVAHHYAHQALHVPGGAVVRVGQQQLKRRRHHGIVQINRKQPLAILAGYDDLHTAERRRHGRRGNEQQHRFAVLDAHSQLLSEVVAVLAGFIIPDAVLPVVQRVKDRIHLLGVTMRIADKKIRLIAGIRLKLCGDLGQRLVRRRYAFIGSRSHSSIPLSAFSGLCFDYLIGRSGNSPAVVKNIRDPCNQLAVIDCRVRQPQRV